MWNGKVVDRRSKHANCDTGPQPRAFELPLRGVSQHEPPRQSGTVRSESEPELGQRRDRSGSEPRTGDHGGARELEKLARGLELEHQSTRDESARSSRFERATS